MSKVIGRKAVGRRRKREAGGAAKVEAVMKAAARSGLLKKKSSRIGGRVSALGDKFAEAFKASRGKVDEDLHLGF